MGRQPPSSCEPPRPDTRIVDAVWQVLQEGLARTPRRPFVLGICGAQGSGKTTLARAIEQDCRRSGLAAATLSLDDLYLTRAERRRLAAQVHPLLLTRGVPGTHDVALGLDVLAALEEGRPVALPRFDKARDDRASRDEWPLAPAPCDVLLFEGWCVGARPQADDALVDPVNRLETSEDPFGIWRRYANEALAGTYQELFGRIDSLVLLAAPGFECVFDWRMQQERELAATAAPNAAGVMDGTGVARFIAHYERLTRHILAEMPQRADLVVRLAEDRSPRAIVRGGIRSAISGMSA